ncbi:MAG: PD40 domain-containing protein [Chloroflexi bacterium]|nr:PD40 domain-containing protein [Chloroflexota bacterium]
MRAYLRILTIACLLSLGASVGAQSTTERPETGTIAYVGVDHNIYVLQPGGEQQPTALTSDASSIRRYVFPTWSTDDRLAFFCCDITFSDDFVLQAFVASSDLTAAKLLYEADNEGYTYAYWSPGACSEGVDCRDLAILITRFSDTFKVELIRQSDGTVSARTAGTGAPFYFSWNGDGHRMLWHRNNRQVSVFDTTSEAEASDLLVVPNGFQAPVWAPTGDRAALVLAERSGQTNALVVIDGSDRTVLVRGIPQAVRGFPNTVAMSWSPDGRYLAYRAVNRLGASAVLVVDVEAAELVASSEDLNVLAFFWAPDSERIAYITPGTRGEPSAGGGVVTRVQGEPTPAFTWSILDVVSDSKTDLVSFVPTSNMLYFLAYFDQYSQSHRIWSPDGRYLTYAERVENAPSLISVLDTQSDPPVVWSPGHGDFSTWSFN